MAGGAAVIGAMRAISLLKRAHQRRRHRADDREHAGRPGDETGRHPDGRQRQDRRGPEHGRRGPADSRRRPLVRAAARRDASRRRRHADRRLRRGARPRGVGPVRSAGAVAPSSSAARADRAGDRCWPMPLFDDYREQIKSEIADMVNVGGRPAGACTAAMFIREFVGDLPWVHLDIAGTAWADEAKPWQPKGATGVAVRTLAELRVHQRRNGAEPAPELVAPCRSNQPCSLPSRLSSMSWKSRSSRRVRGHLVGALGLTGVMLLAALLLGRFSARSSIGIKKLRAKYGLEPVPDAEAMRVTVVVYALAATATSRSLMPFQRLAPRLTASSQRHRPSRPSATADTGRPHRTGTRRSAAGMTPSSAERLPACW